MSCYNYCKNINKEVRILSFADNLRAVRKERNISQEGLAEIRSQSKEQVFEC